MNELATERLILRRFCANDLADLREFVCDARVVEFEPYPPMNEDESAQALERRISTDEMLAVVLRDTGKLIGNVYLGKRAHESLELGYLLNRAYWKNGYASEACARAVEAAFAAGAHRVFAECDPKNPNSWRLLERIGFKREAWLRQNVFFRRDDAGQPVWKDTYIYARLACDL